MAMRYPQGTLYHHLKDAVLRGEVSLTVHPTLGLHLFCYTRQTVFSKQWTDAARIARGVVFDPADGRLVALAMPKFFNFKEVSNAVPQCGYSVHEKLDGSMICAWYYDGRWHCSTKGSFVSEQARWAAQELARGPIDRLDPQMTYVFEAVSAETRVVVPYAFEGLVLLCAYHNKTGVKHMPSDLAHLGYRVPRVFAFSLADTLEEARKIPFTQEGYVLHFDNGEMLKIKGDEYCMVHQMVTGCTPLNVWDALLQHLEAAGPRDLVDGFMRSEVYTTTVESLPEELRKDYSQILRLVGEAYGRKFAELTRAYEGACMATATWMNKEIGLSKEIDAEVKAFVFMGRARTPEVVALALARKAMAAVRPERNVLEGYVPSGVMDRFEEG
jgi:RNA ligase